MILLRLKKIPQIYVRNFSVLQSSRSQILTSEVNNYQKNQSCLQIQQKRQFSYTTAITTLWQSISNSTPVHYFQQGIIQVHDITGLPWWATVIISTVFLRTVVTLPFAIYQNKISARIELLTLEMPEIVQGLKRETAIAIKQFKWSEQQARVTYNRSLRKQWNKLIVRDNCHPAKTMILLWTQIPLWIINSVSLRNLVFMLPNPNTLEAKVIFTELTLGGFGWMTNLTEVDSSLILPVLLGIINLSIIEIQAMSRIRPPSKINTIATNFFRLISIGMVPIAAAVPSCLTLYWVTSSTYGLIQNLALLSPKVKRTFGIPETPSELENPYKHLADTLVNRINGVKTVLPITVINNNNNNNKDNETKKNS